VYVYSSLILCESRMTDLSRANDKQGEEKRNSSKRFTMNSASVGGHLGVPKISPSLEGWEAVWRAGDASSFCNSHPTSAGRHDHSGTSLTSM